MDISGDAWEVPGGITAYEPNFRRSPVPSTLCTSPGAPVCLLLLSTRQRLEVSICACGLGPAQGASEVLLTGETKAQS